MIFWNTENVLCNLLFIIFKIDLSFYFLLFGEEEAGEKEDAGWLRSGEKEKKYENNPK